MWQENSNHAGSGFYDFVMLIMESKISTSRYAAAESDKFILQRRKNVGESNLNFLRKDYLSLADYVHEFNAGQYMSSRAK